MHLWCVVCSPGEYICIGKERAPPLRYRISDMVSFTMVASCAYPNVSIDLENLFYHIFSFFGVPSPATSATVTKTSFVLNQGSTKGAL